MQEMVKNDQIEPLAVNMIRQDGTRLPCLVSSALIRNAAGEPLAIIGVSQDISELKRAEEAVRESEAHFRAIFEYAPVGMVTTDCNGRFLQTNPAYQAIVGYSAAELQGMTLQQLTHPEDLPELLRQRGEVLAGQRPYYSIEKRNLRKDGEIVWVNLMSARSDRWPEPAPDRGHDHRYYRPEAGGGGVS